jgi:hypothetical protein
MKFLGRGKEEKGLGERRGKKERGCLEVWSSLSML